MGASQELFQPAQFPKQLHPRRDMIVIGQIFDGHPPQLFGWIHRLGLAGGQLAHGIQVDEALFLAVVIFLLVFVPAEGFGDADGHVPASLKLAVEHVLHTPLAFEPAAKQPPGLAVRVTGRVELAEQDVAIVFDDGDGHEDGCHGVGAFMSDLFLVTKR